MTMTKPFSKLTALILLAALIGCMPMGKPFSAGLTPIGLAAANADLDKYFELICHRSGLKGERAPSAKPCMKSGTMPAEWSVLVHTGYNDIDRRCESYLSRLDQRYATNSSAGLEPSTIRQIVEEHRARFRKSAAATSIRYRPDAVYLLRAYLRLCTPEFIAMTANDYARAAASDEHSDENLVIDTASLLSAMVSGEFDEQRSFSTPAFSRQRPDLNRIFTGGYADTDDLEQIQMAFCLQGHGIGQIGPRTMAAIEIFEQTLREEIARETGRDIGNAHADGKIDLRLEFADAVKFGDCDVRSFKNYFELWAFSTEAENGGRVEALDRVASLATQLNQRLASHGVSLPMNIAMSNPQLRDAIRTAKRAYGVTTPHPFLEEQLTPTLYAQLLAGDPPSPVR